MATTAARRRQRSKYRRASTARCALAFAATLAATACSGDGDDAQAAAADPAPSDDPARDAAPATPASPGADSATPAPAPPAPDPAEAQRRQLASEATKLTEDFAAAMLTIEDLESARAAVARIAQIDAQFQDLAARMQDAGAPDPEHAAEFRDAHNRASEAIQRDLEPVGQTIASNPQINQLVAEAVREFSKTVSNPIFAAYGVDGK